MLFKDPCSLKRYSLWLCCCEIVAESVLGRRRGLPLAHDLMRCMQSSVGDPWSSRGVWAQPGWAPSDSVMAPREAAKYLLVTVGKPPLPISLSWEWEVGGMEHSICSALRMIQMQGSRGNKDGAGPECMTKKREENSENSIISKHKSPCLNRSKRFEQTTSPKKINA